MPAAHRACACIAWPATLPSCWPGSLHHETCKSRWAPLTPQDVDIDNDADARAEYSEKIRAFYDFVREWKEQEAEEQRLQRMVAAQAGLPMLALGQAGSERRQVASL